jgi:transcriptional regulator with XRE-family HTH domain
MIEKELLWKFGQRIKQLRAEKGFTQIALANILDIEKSNLSRLESGRKNPKLTTLINLANALGVTYNELLDF